MPRYSRSSPQETQEHDEDFFEDRSVSVEESGLSVKKRIFSRFSRNQLIGILGGLVLVGGLIYIKSQDTLLTGQKDAEQASQQEIATIVHQVGKLIVLPDREDPTIATVTDPEALKSQPFFTKAKVGDKVLIYTNARKAILYDPEAHKIVEVAPLNIGQ